MLKSHNFLFSKNISLNFPLNMPFRRYISHREMLFSALSHLLSLTFTVLTFSTRFYPAWKKTGNHYLKKKEGKDKDEFVSFFNFESFLLLFHSETQTFCDIFSLSLLVYMGQSPPPSQTLRTTFSMPPSVP